MVAVVELNKHAVHEDPVQTDRHESSRDDEVGLVLE